MDVQSVVLLELCRHNLDWVNSSYPLPSTAISAGTQIPLKEVRKALKTLKELELVRSFKACYMGEERNCILNGWGITDKAVNTVEYEKAKQEMEFYIQNIEKILNETK